MVISLSPIWPCSPIRIRLLLGTRRRYPRAATRPYGLPVFSHPTRHMPSNSTHSSHYSLAAQYSLNTTHNPAPCRKYGWYLRMSHPPPPATTTRLSISADSLPDRSSSHL